MAMSSSRASQCLRSRATGAGDAAGFFRCPLRLLPAAGSSPGCLELAGELRTATHERRSLLGSRSEVRLKDRDSRRNVGVSSRPAARPRSQCVCLATFKSRASSRACGRPKSSSPASPSRRARHVQRTSQKPLQPPRFRQDVRLGVPVTAAPFFRLLWRANARVRPRVRLARAVRGRSVAGAVFLFDDRTSARQVRRLGA